MQTVRIHNLVVSRLILGTNPVNGFSHQGVERDQEMRSYFTPAQVLALFQQAERLGVNALLARTDEATAARLQDYRAAGGRMQWFAQTAPELGEEQSIKLAARHGASAAHIHGGVMDHAFANRQLERIQPVLDRIRGMGMLAGIAAHQAGVVEWAEANLDLDYYMCCYYNPIPRQQHAAHVSGLVEVYAEEDRQRMVQLIQRLTRPVIHYKVLAAGRNDPRAALAFAAAHLREHDAVCVGIYPPDAPDILAADIGFLEAGLRDAAASRSL